MNTDNKILFEADDDWSDIDFSDLVDEPDGPKSSDGTEEAGNEDAAAEAEKENTAEAPEANPADEATEDGAEDQTATEPMSGTDQFFDLKVLGEDRRLSRDEMIAAAQKGLDYDRIRSKYSEAQKEREANAPAVELVKELAEAQGVSVDQLITNVRAAALARKEGIDIKTATERVQIKAREDAVAKREAVFKQQDEAEQKSAAEREARSKQFVQFFQRHPNVKPDDIPKQCFIDMKNGIPLEYSYNNQLVARQASQNNADLKAMSEKDKRIKELEAQIAELGKKSATQSQNQINAARSVGSADTAGKGSKDDAFDAAWYDGT